MGDAPPEYAEVVILVHPEAVEGVSDALLCAGARGVAEERSPLHTRLIAYLPADDRLDERLASIRQRLQALEREGLRLGPGTLSSRRVPQQAWAELWKEHFPVQHVAPGLVIAPSWENYQARAGECVVVLDPGPAFGTGGHATTRLCLRLLVAHISPGDRVADVGCGSGILAIAAAMLGAREVVATDHDLSAVAVARQNARRNRVEDCVQVVQADLLPEEYGAFDLILCNIVAEEVMRLAPGLRRRLPPGGRFIGSGFQAVALPGVEEALAQAGLRLLTTSAEEGWVACVAVRPAPGQ